MNTRSPVTSSSGYDDDADERPAKRQRTATGPREIGIMAKPTPGSSFRFLGSSSGIHFIRTVYSAFARRSAQNQAKVVPGEDDQLHGSPDATEQNSELWYKDELDYTRRPFTFEELVTWTRSYFENWHPMFPYLHAPTILHTLEKASKSGLASVSRNERIIIRSIISISLADQRQRPNTRAEPVPANLVFWTAAQAMDSLQALFSEPTTVQLLQAAFSVELFLTSLLRLNAASRIGGVVTRIAFHLGLHRCPSRFPFLDDIELRRRLFWSIYCLERYLSQALGVPLSIQDSDIDVCLPGHERHNQKEDHTGTNKHLRLLRYLAQFAQVRGSILELRNKSILHSQDNPTGAIQVNGQLASWWNEVYDDVNPVDTGEEPEDQEMLRPFHRLVLVILRYESIISMNRPLLASEKFTPESGTALQVCIESSRSLITDLTRYLNSKSPKSQENANVAPLIWPSFTWAVWMACLILMYAAWEREFPVQAASRYAKLGLSILENLSLRGSSWPKTCIEAIRDLESALCKTGHEADRAAMVPFTKDHPPHIADNHHILSDQHDLAPPPPTSSGDNVQEQNNAVLETPNLQTHRPDTEAMPSTNNHISHAIFPQDPAIDINYSSAGLIFGDNGFPSYSGFPGQEGFSGDLEALFDVWSVADGPWLIHENGL